MFSLYLHIPFCRYKCAYCNFFVTPEDLVETKKMDILKESYTQILHQQIAYRKQIFPDQQLKTIYLGGGTPLQLGKQNLISIIETIFHTRDCTHLEELSIELNPDPIDQTLLFIEEVTARRSQLFRLRFSIGIQSFDDMILAETKRSYTYAQLPDFFRQLSRLKGAHVCYNADFIAFGDMSSGKQKATQPFLPWGEEQREFFEVLVDSRLFDGFSIYTLELFPGSDRYNQELRAKNTISPLVKEGMGEVSETIGEEFDRLASVISDAGYRRYELSNFALAGRRSLHNMVYRTMQPYLGIGINASSMLPIELAKSIPDVSLPPTDLHGLRFRSPDQRKTLQQGVMIDSSSLEYLDTRKWLIDALMLQLRTDQRVGDRKAYESILEPNRPATLATRVERGLMLRDETHGWRLSDAGLDLYNSIVTDLIQFIE